MNLSDGDGYPRTAIIKLGWMALMVLASSGLIVVVLSIYLAAWARSERRSSLPLFGFITFVVLIVVELLVAPFKWGSFAVEVLSYSEIGIYVAATFGLRREIIRYCKDRFGWEPRFNIAWTLLFSSVYLNNCLSPDREAVASEMTTLKL